MIFWEKNEEKKRGFPGKCEVFKKKIVHFMDFFFQNFMEKSAGEYGFKKGFSEIFTWKNDIALFVEKKLYSL